MSAPEIACACDDSENERYIPDGLSSRNALDSESRPGFNYGLGPAQFFTILSPSSCCSTGHGA
jgi:hypothetical protein